MMSSKDMPIAGRVWTGRLLVIAALTRKQPHDFIADTIREAVYFDFFSDHADHGLDIDLTVGLADDPVPVGRQLTVVFPAVVTIFNPRMSDQEIHAQVRGLVEESIKNWYEGPKKFEVVLVEKPHDPDLVHD